MATQFPDIMKNAQTDLTATVEGRFSPTDWAQILERAEQQLRENRRAEPHSDETLAWQAVVRDFYLNHHWGYRADYRPPRVVRPRNLGITFIWMAFNSMCTIKVALLWFGQIYSRSDQPGDKWIFFILIFFVVGNFIYFIWRNHDHPD